jgi:hypothetical protein
VRIALWGSVTLMLLISDKGEQIVSVTVPIQYRKAVQGVLLLSTRSGEIDEILAEERKQHLRLGAYRPGSDAGSLTIQCQRATCHFIIESSGIPGIA